MRARISYEYRVYVIRLHPSFADKPEVQQRNPNRILGKDCLYVGETSKTPEERFEDHLNGKKSKRGFEIRSRKIKGYVDKLMPELYSHLPAFKTRAEAEKMQDQLARDLRNQGYTVWEGFSGPYKFAA